MSDPGSFGVASELEDLIKREATETALGDFVSTAQHILQGPGVGVTGHGVLPLPVDGGVASALERTVSSAPVQAADQGTAWMVDASLLSFANAAWKNSGVPPTILSAVSSDLALPGTASCSASLKCLLVAGSGSGAHVKKALSDPPQGASWGRFLAGRKARRALRPPSPLFPQPSCPSAPVPRLLWHSCRLPAE
jgi:hypothetical protein